jgi:FtsH-binding integral membrane protein
MDSGVQQAESGPRATSWGAATLRAAIMVVYSFLVFALIPNSLLAYLTTRLTPTARDLVMVGWWVLAFVVGCVVFVRLQPRSGD